jgi:PAS domain S-box-containing protein
MSEFDLVPRAVLDAFKEGIILADPAGAILLVNREAQDVLGCGGDELVGQPLQAIMDRRQDAGLTVELWGYLDTARGRLIRRRRQRTRPPGAQVPARQAREHVARCDRRLLIISIGSTVSSQPSAHAREYERRLRVLRMLGKAIRAARTAEAAAQAALCHLRRLVPYTQAQVLSFDSPADEARVLAAFSRVAATHAGEPLPLRIADLAGAFRGEQPIVIGDAGALSSDEQPAEILRLPDMRSYIAAPLVADGKLAGAITVAASEANVFDHSHAEIVGAVAGLLASALQNGDLARQVQAGTKRLRALSSQLMEIQENERRHIARELHDEIGQSLTAVKINLETILRLPSNEAVRPHIEESVAIVGRVLQQVRAISLDLRPAMLDELGLESALRWYIGRQAERGCCAIEFVAGPLGRCVPPEVQTTCYRVVQEALTNIARHSQAKHAWVDLRQCGAALRLVVRDDGVGFDVREAEAGAAQGLSLGLVSMQERALLAGGRLDIESARGHGTTIRATFPLHL